MERTDAAVVGIGEIVPDRLAHVAVEALPRDVDQDRDEAIEAVAPRQNAHARPLVELQHRQRKVIERVVVELEQLVARIILQHVDQRLAGMAVRIEAGAPHDGVDLAAQIRDRARRARIGGRREQPDDAELADELAVGVEALDADVVHVDVPVHARAHGGLGDDEQRRLVQQRADLRRDDEGLVPSLHGRHLAPAQDTEPAGENRLQRGLAGGEGVVANAEEGEIVRDQPFQELDGLGDLGDRRRRRIGLEPGNLGGDARGHLAPILDAGPDIGEHPLDRRDDLGAPAPRRRCARHGCG